MTDTALAGFSLPPEVEAAAEYPSDLHQGFAEAGLLRAIVPDDCGGLGLGNLGRAVLIEEVAYVSAAVSMIPQVNELGCTPIAIAGTSGQRQARAAPVARGELYASYGLTEPDAGSDVGALRTRVERDGDGWLLSGRKAWICNVRRPGFGIVFARTSPDGKRGLSAFIVPTDAPGFEVLGAEPATDVFVGHGYSRNNPVERFMRDAKVTQLYEGANSIQRLVIARHLAKTARAKAERGRSRLNAAE